MSGWDAWYAHVKPCRGLVKGAIVNQAGQVCHQEGVTLSDADVASLKSCWEGAGTVFTVGDIKFMKLAGDDEQLQFRGNGAPACVAKTATLWLIAIGDEKTTSGNLSLDLSKAVETFKASNL